MSLQPEQGAMQSRARAIAALLEQLKDEPVIICNGPGTRAIGMNSGINVLGQGNRANSTIGRAVQLTVRNVGGGRPGEVDRATHGNPGKVSFCFAEDELNSPWESLAVERGFRVERVLDDLQGIARTIVLRRP